MTTASACQWTGYRGTSRVTSYRRPERGFSLLEVLVAFAVTALFFGAILPAAVSSLDRLADVRLRSRALAIARSTLERYVAIARFEEGTFEGRQADLVWRTSIARLQPAPTAESGGALALRQIRVQVLTADAQPIITLATYRLGEIR